jgi:hypothetical protein
MIQSVKELSDVHLKYPASVLAHRLLPERLQRVMRRASLPKTVRAVVKLRLLRKDSVLLPYITSSFHQVSLARSSGRTEDGAWCIYRFGVPYVNGNLRENAGS